jgi:alanine-synthesizing transaminase
MEVCGCKGQPESGETMKQAEPFSFSRRSRLADGCGGLDPVDHWCAVYASEHGPVLDLIGSNPTQAGLDYGDLSRLMHRIGSDPDLMRYDAQPMGNGQVRAAICNYYRVAAGVPIDPGQIAVTASTSEAYTVIFDLIADPGDTVLIPEPGYPLLEVIAATSGLTLASYHLKQGLDGFWRLDHDSVQRAVQPGVRAIILISPHNPTGSVLTAEDLVFLESLCLEHGLFLIVDEVFRDFALPGRAQPSRLYSLRCPTFVLHGMSKLALLPQLKLAWIVMLGDPAMMPKMRDGIAWLLDGLLSVSAFAQNATPVLLAEIGGIQKQVRNRCRSNHLRLHAWAEALGLKIDPFSGSWYGLVREDPRWRGEDVSVLIAKHCGVRIHPGYFYSMPDRDAMVFSLLTSPEVLEEGLLRIGSFLE